MSEALERAIQRTKERLGKEIFDAVKVSTIQDLQQLLKDLDPANNYIDNKQTDAVVTVDNENYKLAIETVSRPKREVLLHGFKQLRHKSALANSTAIIINNVEMKSATNNGIHSWCWVDDLIKRWLGGYRDGLLICWKLNDYVYKYDIFEHKLTRDKE